MKQQQDRIPLYAERTFSQKLGDTLDFARCHWRVLGRTMLYLTLPFCIVQGLCLNSYFDLFAGAELLGEGSGMAGLTGLLSSIGGLIGLGAVATLLVSATVYALMRLAEDPNQDIDTLSMTRLWPHLVHCLRRSLVLILAFLVIGCAVLALLGLSIVVNGVLFLFLYAVAMVALMPLLMLWPAYMLSDDSLKTVFPRALRYGYKTWGGTFAILIVVGTLVNVATSLLGMPYYILQLLQLFFRDDSSSALFSFTLSPWYTALTYLFGVLFLQINYLGYGILAIALGYQYGHAAERLDGVAVEQDVERFETLADDGGKAAFDEIDDFESL